MGLGDWQTITDAATHASAPAWVQAIGSVVAILVAVAIPAWQRWQARNDAEHERRIRARSIALAIYLPVMETKARLEGSLGRLESTCNEIGMQISSDFYDALMVEMPPVLIQSIPDLYLLREAGEEIQHVVSVVNVLNSMLSAPQARLTGVLDEEMALEILGTLAPGHYQALNRIDIAMEEMDKILGSDGPLDAEVPVP